jgi:hypothetical protein
MEDFKNVFDAGITKEELKELYGKVVTREKYLREVKDQEWRYYGLFELYDYRNDSERADYYWVTCKTLCLKSTSSLL